MTHICVGKLTIIGSDNGLSPERCQGIIWTNAGILLIGTLALRNKLQWNFNRNSNIFIQENAFESVVCETAAILSLPQCVNLCQAITVSADISTFRTFRLGHMQISVVIAGDSISIIYTHPHVHWDDQVKCTLISRFIGPTWGPSGADRTQMGPMLAQWTLLSGVVSNPENEFDTSAYIFWWSFLYQP